MLTGASLYPRCSAIALKVSNFACVLSAAAFDQPAAANACYTCSALPISMRFVMSLGFDGFCAHV